MSIYKRDKMYYYDITTPNGQRIVKSLGTSEKREAKQTHDRIKNVLWQQQYLDKKPVVMREQACHKWLDDKSDKRSLDSDARIIENYTKYFSGIGIHELTTDRIESVTKK